MSSRAMFQEFYEDASERNVVRFLTGDRRNPGSIISSLHATRENARTIREMMPRVAFEYINQLYLFAHHEFSGSLSRARRTEVLEGILSRAQQFDGFLHGAMLRDQNWAFLNLGKHLERADMTTRIIEVRASSPLEVDAGLEPFMQLQWRSILRSLHAMQNYNIHFQEPVQQALALEFLFCSTDLPRSVAYCLHEIRSQLRRLPRNDKLLRSCNRIIRFLGKVDVSTLDGASLSDFIDESQRAIAELHVAISKAFFHARSRRSSQKARRSREQSQRNGAAIG